MKNFLGFYCLMFVIMLLNTALILWLIRFCSVIEAKILATIITVIISFLMSAALLGKKTKKV